MITKLKKVYYCEFCGKHGLHPYYLKDHELTCNMNPNRECKICDMTGSHFNSLVEKYNDSYRIFYHDDTSDGAIEYKKKNGVYSQPNWLYWTTGRENYYDRVLWKKDITIKEIIEDCENCPVCVLALLKITGLINMPGIDYNYDKEFKAWQSSKECEQQSYCDYY